MDKRGVSCFLEKIFRQKWNCRRKKMRLHFKLRYQFDPSDYIA